MTEAFVGGRSAKAVDFVLASLYEPGQRAPGIFAKLLLALHEARRRQAERDMRRYQHLLNRYARRDEGNTPVERR